MPPVLHAGGGGSARPAPVCSRAAARAPERGAGGQAGFTLIEVLVTLALIALVVGSAVAGVRSLAKSDLRDSATKMAGAIRYLFDRASTTGRVHRLVVDLDTGKYWAETSEDRFLMPRDRETEDSRQEEAEDKAREEEEQQRLAEESEQEEQYAGGVPLRYRPREFRPKRAKWSAFKESAIKPRELKRGVVIAGLYTPRLAEPLAAGQGYIYFFPLGMTEAAIVHLSDHDRESFYSLVVHPLTGRVRVYNQYVEPRIDKQYDDSGQEVVR